MSAGAGAKSPAIVKRFTSSHFSSPFDVCTFQMIEKKEETFSDETNEPVFLLCVSPAQVRENSVNQGHPG